MEVFILFLLSSEALNPVSRHCWIMCTVVGNFFSFCAFSKFTFLEICYSQLKWVDLLHLTITEVGRYARLLRQSSG